MSTSLAGDYCAGKGVVNRGVGVTSSVFCFLSLSSFSCKGTMAYQWKNGEACKQTVFFFLREDKDSTEKQKNFEPQSWESKKKVLLGVKESYFRKRKG